MQLDQISVVIPTYNPPLLQLDFFIEELLNKGYKKIIVVNDGSDNSYKDFFIKLKNKEIIVLHHVKNKGKGATLKLAFNYCLNNFSDLQGIITADADGQHLGFV